MGKAFAIILVYVAIFIITSAIFGPLAGGGITLGVFILTVAINLYGHYS